jgi:predicted transcriptional regulator
MSWHDCNAAERDVLVALFRTDGLTNRQVSDEIERPTSSVSRALQSLDDKGLVDRDGEGQTGRTGTTNRLSDKGHAIVTAQADKFAEAL